jgi:lipoate-protein ligase A
VVPGRGTAGALHARALDTGGRLVEWLEVTRPAVVVGSRQSVEEVDAEAAASQGFDVVRRRSGGGAVLLEPGSSAWLDVTIARDDDLWSDDVGVAFEWLGQAWAGALAALGLVPEVHTGRLIESPWSRQVCFAGLGPGEVVVGGRKVVGISQRRTREAARFQCIAYRRWDPGPLLALLALPDERRRDGALALADVAAGIDVEPEALVSALVASLPA